MTTYQARVYDLDGTLARLNVDWEQTTVDVRSQLTNKGLNSDGETLWELFEDAVADGHRTVVEDIISEHERSGAAIADRLPRADDLPASVPVGVCSLNCEAACEIALEQIGILHHIDVIVGRDTVATQKPDPKPLLWAIEQLGVSPEKAVFIGDTDRDRETADRAGVSFEFAYP